MSRNGRNEEGETYDAIVVGARVAGAATALQLARAGHRVLVVDRRRPGTDTLSTHALMRAGVLQLQRWGVLERLIEVGTPAVRQTVIHYGERSDTIVMKPKFGVDALYAPRRFVLDTVLVEAAAEAGAEVRFGVTIDELTKDAEGRVGGIVGRGADGERVEARARIVVGADGVRSAVARAVGAEKIWAGSHCTGVVYAYFSGRMCEGYEWFYGETAAAGILPTNQDQTLVWAGVPRQRFLSEVRGDLASTFWRILEEVAPDAATAARAATRESRFHGFPGLPGYLRRAWGPGWALVGDASHFKDPLSAHGITDALRDAEFLAQAISSSLGGWSGEAEALAAYARIRDRLSGDMIRVTDRVASFDWSLEEVRDLLLEMSVAMNEEADDLLSLEILQQATAA